MTVAELRELLAGHPDDMRVVGVGYEGGCADPKARNPTYFQVLYLDRKRAEDMKSPSPIGTTGRYWRHLMKTLKRLQAARGRF